MAKFRLCMDSQAASDQISADSAWAVQLSLTATPTLLTKRHAPAVGVTGATAAIAEWLDEYESRRIVPH